MSRKVSIDLGNGLAIVVAVPVGLEAGVATRLNGRKVVVSKASSAGRNRYVVGRFWNYDEAIADRVSPPLPLGMALIVAAYWLDRGDWSY